MRAGGQGHLRVEEEGQLAFSLLPASSLGIEHRLGTVLGNPSALRCVTWSGMGLGWVRLLSCEGATGFFFWALDRIGQRALIGGTVVYCGLYMCLVSTMWVWVWVWVWLRGCGCFKLELVDIVKKSGERYNVK